MTYRIESDVPPPGAHSSDRHVKRQYPLDSLSVGQSFAVPLSEGPTREAVIRRVATAVYRRHAKRTGVRYTWQVQDDTHIRVWRTV